MRIILFTTLLLQSLASWAQPGVAPEREIEGKRYYVHKVEAGNTLWGLQQMYGVKAEKIMESNPELASGLKTGQTVLIPIPGDATTAQQEAVTSEYKVKKGETLYGLSRKFNTTVDELIRLNPELASSTLQKGQRIQVPGVFEDNDTEEDDADTANVVVDNVPNPFIVDTIQTLDGDSHQVSVRFNDSIVHHKVLAHETMYNISKRFMVSIETIMKENNLSSTRLSEGQVLKIPIKKERIEKLVIKPVPDKYDPNGTDSIIFEEKDRYKIAVIMPFFLEHGKGYSEYLSDVSTQFYMGSLMAIDTLKKLGLNADVQYYDSKRDSATVLKILNTPGFENTDLIIGPLLPNTQGLVADFCKKHSIRLMVPVTVETSILQENRLVYSAVPSSITLIEELGDYVAKHHQKDRVILVKPTKQEDMPLYEAFRDAYNGAEVTGAKAALNETTMDGMKNYMTNKSNTVIVMPTDNRHNAEKFVSEVSRSDFRCKKNGIYIYGTKEWLDFTGIHNSYKNEYNFRHASPNHLDYYTDLMIEVNQGYRTRYKTDMSKMAVQGYDVMLYSCALFFLDGKPVHLLMNDFDIRQVDSADGYENRHIFVLEQEDYELVNADELKND